MSALEAPDEKGPEILRREQQKLALLMAVCTHALAALVLIHLETPLLLQIAHVV